MYNPQRLGPGEEEVWFAEGEFDTLALIDQGLSAIGIHGVSNVKTKAEVDKDSDVEPSAAGFRRSWQLLFSDTLCIVMFDNDEAGRPAGRHLARGLGGVAFDEWDDAHNDINDWHRDDRTGLGDTLGRFRYRVRRSVGMDAW